MTPHPAAAHLTLDPATTDETLATIFAAQRSDLDRTPAQHQTQREAAAALIAALRPRDPMEAAYATGAAAAHYGSMECFRRAMFPDLPDNLAIRWHGKAVALSRLNTEMVRTLREHQAATPHVQPQPAARPTVPSLPAPALAARPAAATPAKPAGKQDPTPSERQSPAPAAPAATTQPAAATPAEPAGRQDPLPSERPLPAPAASAATTQPTAGTSAHTAGRQDPMSSERPPPAPTTATVRAQLAAALAATPVRRQVPMSSERPSLTPSARILSTHPAATSFLSAPAPRQNLRAELLGSTADVAVMVATANARIRLRAK